MIAFIDLMFYLNGHLMKYLITILLALSSSWIFGQYTIQPKPIGDESALVYTQEQILDVRLHTHGISFGYTKASIQTWYKTVYRYFDIGSLRDSREFSQNFRFFNQGIFRETSKPFVYGKQNSLYALRAGIGKRRSFSEKARKKSVIVGFAYEYGVTLGVLKPYYLKLTRFIDGGTEQRISVEKYSEENADIFLDETLIFGGAEFRRGLNELKLRPGFHGKVGMNFAWGNVDRLIKAIEVGIMGDVFLSSVPIMVADQNRPYFLNLYLSVQLGRRS